MDIDEFTPQREQTDGDGLRVLKTSLLAQQTASPGSPHLTSAPLGPELPIMGPSLPPVGMATTSDEPSNHSLSPHTTERNLVRDLTLPAVPNMNLPPSPPGSPARDIDKKFRHFLDLKNQGHHFNERLASSYGAKNPSITEKLMTFAGVGSLDSRDGLRAQYQTSLSSDLAGPDSFPDGAFKPELKKTQARIAKQREVDRASGKRSLEFVPPYSATQQKSAPLSFPR